MQLSEEAIKEYQQIYFNHYGEEISREEALSQGTNLLQLMNLLSYIDTKE